MSIYRLLDENRDTKWIKGYSCYMSDFDVVDEIGEEQFDDMYERYCDWCFYHGYGSCDKCRKHYRSIKLSIKINNKHKLITGLNVWD